MIGNFEVRLSCIDISYAGRLEYVVDSRNQTLPEGQSYRDCFLYLGIFSNLNYDDPAAAAIDLYDSLTLADVEDWFIGAYLVDALEEVY